MKIKSKETALMVFSLSARKEAQRKRLFSSGKRAVTYDFFDQLINQTAEIAFSAGIDVIWVDERKQRGANFGDRYTNAFEDIFNQGYENIISIGNDCPELTSALLKTAINELKKEKLVLGPALDGGLYLLGLNQNLFNAEEFRSLPWLQETLYTELAFSALRKGLAYHCLETLSDIDNTKDIKEFAFRNPGTLLSNFIIQYLLEFSQKFNSTSFTFISLFRKEQNFLRGPPLFSQGVIVSIE